MEVTALHVRLLMTVLLLLVAEVDFSYSQKAGFPQVVPSRQQHFQYEPIAVSCEGLEGLTGWRVMKKVKGGVQTCAPIWSASTGPCRIQNALLSDTGEYWCEMGGRKSETVNITVTAAHVILESPVHPVMEGDAVTLRCRTKPSSNLSADFFKDGHLMESGSAGNLTFTSVSRSNEGLYRCRLSGAGESPESWLHVRAPDQADAEFPQLPLPLWVGLGVCLFLVALLLLIVLLRWRKQQTSRNVRDDTTTSAYFQTSPFPQTVSRQASVAVPIDGTYAVVTKAMMEQGY